MKTNELLRLSSETTLGIDIGGTHIRWVLSNSSSYGKIEKLRSPKTYDGILKILLEIIAKAQSKEQVEKIGIGLPGRTDPEKPIWIPMLPFLNQSNLVADLEAKASIRVTLINDAQAALVGEVDFGAAKGCRNAILVTLGTGIGGGIMIDGKIYIGHNGTAGSFGWLMAPVRVHANPEHGPWERWSSGNSLANIAQGLGLSVDQLMNEGYEEIDSVAHNAVEDFAIRIGKGLGSLVSLFDPQVVIVSGGLVDSWKVLSHGVHEGFTHTASPSVRNTPIKVAGLGSESGAIGAASAARTYFKEINSKKTVNLTREEHHAQ
jgi:predicted NBD/HSP70 family sugar kinase